MSYNGQSEAELLKPVEHVEVEIDCSVPIEVIESAVLNGDLKSRNTLAVAGGLSIKEIITFKQAVETPLEDLNHSGVTLLVLRQARAAKKRGDYTSYTYLSATIGFYPPETGDVVFDPANVVLNPIARHSFRPDNELSDFRLQNELTRAICVPPMKKS